MNGTRKEDEMNAQEYIELANRTCKQFPDGMKLDTQQANLIHAVLGIAGEAGELVDGFKKSLIYGRLLDEENLKEEAGDILWYMALLLKTLGTNFETVMAENISKLMKRYPEKYTDAHAIARLDKIGE